MDDKQGIVILAIITAILGVVKSILEIIKLILELLEKAKAHSKRKPTKPKRRK